MTTTQPQKIKLDDKAIVFILYSIMAVCFMYCFACEVLVFVVYLHFLPCQTIWLANLTACSYACIVVLAANLNIFKINVLE